MRFVEHLLRDVRFAVRGVRKEPAFALVIVLTLTLAIGANTAMFSLFDAVVLRALPVPEPDRLVLFSESAGEGTRTSTTIPTGRWELFSAEAYTFLRDQPLPYQALAAVRSGETTVSVRIPGTLDAGIQRAQ